MSNVVLEACEVTKTFHRAGEVSIRAVDGVSFEIREGESFGLLGESGSGKSTLARLLARLTEPTSGEIIFRGTTLGKVSERQMRQIREQIQIVFQNPYSSLNPRMTVRQLIAEPLIVHHRLPNAALDKRVHE